MILWWTALKHNDRMTGSSPPSWSLLEPCLRLEALLDAGSFRRDPPAGPSPHLARWGIRAQEDDGVVTGDGRLGGMAIAVAAQDGRFLGGSVGERHARALERLFSRAVEERLPVLLLLESGGVRLYEANAAELAAARALSQLLTLRTAGLATLAVATGSCFGGASVLACACASLLMLPHALLGLSGPKVIETAAGRDELDASDAALIRSIFGAEARAKTGIASMVDDDASEVRAAAREGLSHAPPLDGRTIAMEHARLMAAARLHGAEPMPCAEPALFADLMPPGSLPLSTGDWLWTVPGMRVDVLMPSGGCAVGPSRALAMTAAVLQFIERHRGKPATLLILEDSTGHEPSRHAEDVGLSRLLAHHAASLAVAKLENHRIIAVLAGTGHSAAFFVNALQAHELHALPGARILAMDPAAVARVTHLSTTQLDALLEDDDLLGQPVRHLQVLGGLSGMVERSPDALLALLSR
jgi:malonate decarboxylase beta subunit